MSTRLTMVTIKKPHPEGGGEEENYEAYQDTETQITIGIYQLKLLRPSVVNSK